MQTPGKAGADALAEAIRRDPEGWYHLLRHSPQLTQVAAAWGTAPPTPVDSGWSHGMERKLVSGEVAAYAGCLHGEPLYGGPVLGIRDTPGTMLDADAQLVRCGWLLVGRPYENGIVVPAAEIPALVRLGYTVQVWLDGERDRIAPRWYRVAAQPGQVSP